MKWILPALVGLAMTLSCQSDPAPRTKLRIGINPWAAWSSIDVADKKGFYEAEGLDVTVVKLVTDQEMAEALIQDRIDIGIGMIGTWIGFSARPGSPSLTIIAETDWSYGGDQIIAKKTVDVTKLKGTTVATYLDQPSVNFFLQEYMKELTPPLKLTDVNLVELESQSIAEEFLKGTYDLTINYEPSSLDQLQPTANGAIVATSRSYPGVIPEGFAMKTDVLGKRVSTDTVKRSLNAWLKAVEWIYGPNGDGQTPDPAHYEEYKTLLKTVHFGEPGKPAELTDLELDRILYGVHVHGKALFNRINGVGLGQRLTKFADADATKPQPQPNGQPLIDFFVEMSQFLSDTGHPLDAKQLVVDTSLALEVSK